MSPDAIGICLAILGIGLCLFFGLRGFTSKVTDRISDVKDAIITELSNIRVKMAKVETRADDIWQLEKGRFEESSSTIEGTLKNFGKVKISAEPAAEMTTYTLEVEKEDLNLNLISRLSKITGLVKTEINLFGSEPRLFPVRPKVIRILVPSTDPKLCTQYISTFLNWLDTKYHSGRQQEIEEFEKGINI